jgi:hypothetical protein
MENEMKNLKRLVCGGLCIGLAAGMALAQTTTQTYRQTGNLVGASATATGANYQANVNISPAALPGNNQEIYMVNWSTTIYGGSVPPPVPCLLPTDPPPLPPDLVSTTASGLVPSSAIQRLPSGGLFVDLDIDKIQVQYFASVQCVNAVCNLIPPPSTFPLKGTFAPITSGPGTFSSSSAGNRSSLTIDPICRFVYSVSGNQLDTSAKFAGQIGVIVVAPMAVGGNAQLHVQKGQLTTTATCTPPPPPM